MVPYALSVSSESLYWEWADSRLQFHSECGMAGLGDCDERAPPRGHRGPPARGVRAGGRLRGAAQGGLGLGRLPARAKEGRLRGVVLR